MKTLYTFLITLIITLPVQANNPIEENAILSDFAQGFRAYPNPNTTGKYIVEFYTLKQEEEITIKVFNLIGKEVYRQHISFHLGPYRGAIRINTLPKGMYLLQISNGDSKQTRRLSFI